MNGTNVKVEVQGLDTSKLPKLSQKEQMEMLKILVAIMIGDYSVKICKH